MPAAGLRVRHGDVDALLLLLRPGVTAAGVVGREGREAGKV